jgi:methionyl-tRNA synthetase
MSFITTAIPYVNARPHLGFAYELVLADVLARHRRRRGREVRFVTGTDENSLKNVVAAARAGVTTRELVDRNADAFRALGPLLDVAPDDFIRTSVDPRHHRAVGWLWRACESRGDLYRKTWTGRYCPGCEAFVDDGETTCLEHGDVLEPVAEENWFFRLSRYRDRVCDAITSGRLRISNEAARAETLAFLNGDVRDLSVSRVATRSGGWGIPVPGDPTQVIYVWFDALANYLASLDLGGDRTLLDRFWTDERERVHVIGKGISRFHAVYWPAFLLSAGLPLPDRIEVHGYITRASEKLSKSGTHVETKEVLDAVGVDALRWFFVRRCRTRGDTDVTVPAIAEAHDHDLADGLGNLIQRCAALVRKVNDGRIPDGGGASATNEELRALAEVIPARVDAALDAFLLDDAVGAICTLIDAANRALEVTQPWRLAKTDPVAAARALYAPLEAARIAIGELQPFVPRLATHLARRLGASNAGNGRAELSPQWGLLPVGALLAIGPPPVPRLVAR